jgi:hypothetical protein
VSAHAAARRAAALAAGPWIPPAPAGRAFARTLAIGDPQSPIDKVFAILERAGALGPDGMLRAEVALVSIGDHFDWAGDLAEAQIHGLRLLRWLAEHPPDQAVILAGNHDLSRVTELWRVTDAQFTAARLLAEQIAAAPGDAELEARFLREHADLPTPEVARRDYSAFTEPQRAFVQALLLHGRLALACAGRTLDGRALLLTHAGVTRRELAILGAEGERDPGALARRLADALAAAVDEVRPRWAAGEPARLRLEPLHIAGAGGREGGGLLYHRPSIRPDATAAPRRFDPRTLPLGLLQACGHAGHRKCRGDLGDWVAASALAVERGGLRTLRTDGERVVYEMGIQPVAPHEGGLYMIDAEMNSVAAVDYPLLELAAIEASLAPP